MICHDDFAIRKPYAGWRDTAHASSFISISTSPQRAATGASDGSPTTSAVARPDGTLLCFQPYGEEGLLIADINIAAATGLLASRYRPG
jgi:hypothetical protein